MEYIAVIFSLIAGVLIGYLWARSKQNSTGTESLNTQQQLTEKEMALAVNLEKINALAKENQKLVLSTEQEITKIREDHTLVVDKLENQLTQERERANMANERLAKAQQVFENQNEKIKGLQDALQESKDEHKREVEDLQKKMTTEFENIANRILEDKSKKFTEQNRANIDIILSPLKEKIVSFEEKVERTYQAESKERVELKVKLEELTKLNQRVSDEANNLAKALKGDNKLQGNWGEMLLEKILERSGLQKDSEYTTQHNTQNNEGKSIKPDVIIHLPDSKHIVIDSKVSLLAYEQYANAEQEEEKERFKKDHISSIRNHIKLLSDKNYQTSAGLTLPDFVLMFIPLESSFSLAIQADQDIFNFAWDRKIVMVSPSTLLATLRTIASIWKQEKQNKNALEIARQGADLYDKLVGFTDDILKIGERLSQTQNVYQDALKKLSTGSGNLIKRAENIKKLGASPTKSFSEKLLNNDEE
jgi:DNA recombination protein RmuC